MARTVDPKRKKVAESEKNLRLAQKELARIKVSSSPVPAGCSKCPNIICKLLLITFFVFCTKLLLYTAPLLAQLHTEVIMLLVR